MGQTEWWLRRLAHEVSPQGACNLSRSAELAGQTTGNSHYVDSTSGKSRDICGRTGKLDDSANLTGYISFQSFKTQSPLTELRKTVIPEIIEHAEPL